jgi:hypothetical protein
MVGIGGCYEPSGRSRWPASEIIDSFLRLAASKRFIEPFIIPTPVRAFIYVNAHALTSLMVS